MTTKEQLLVSSPHHSRLLKSANDEPVRANSKQNNAQCQYHFVLLPGFSMLSLTSALETLQNANLCADRALYDWVLCSIDAAPVRSSLGTLAALDQTLESCTILTNIVIVGGLAIQDVPNCKLKAWLSRNARGNVRVTGLATAAFVLAELGLLAEAPATLHWQYRDSFRERFPDVALADRPHVATGVRCSSSGGVSSIDLFLEFIAQDHGYEFSEAVAECMNYTTIRQIQNSASAEAPASKRVRNPKLAAVIGAMEQTLEEPQTPSDLARKAGISTRQLERLFRNHLSATPKQYYMRLRLRRAYFLLTQTNMSSLDVALACGFQASSHFSKCFRQQFGLTPAQLRRSV